MHSFIVMCSAEVVWVRVWAVGEQVQRCVNCIGGTKVVDGGWKVLETHMNLSKLPMYI